MSDQRSKGIEFADKKLDPAIAGWLKSMPGKPGIGSAMAELALDFAFGSVWMRTGLSLDKRSAVVLGALIASNQWEEFKIHLDIALKNGLTPKEIEEVIVQTIPYVGFPAAARASGVWHEVQAAHG